MRRLVPPLQNLTNYDDAFKKKKNLLETPEIGCITETQGSNVNNTSLTKHKSGKKKVSLKEDFHNQNKTKNPPKSIIEIETTSEFNKELSTNELSIEETDEATLLCNSKFYLKKV